MSRQPTQIIQSQVKLPFSVALEVVLQGIRIRMGRSVVTMMGVVLGVAFLMSVFCSNMIRKGMSEEREIRSEVQRMISFLEADTGSVEGRVLGVIATGKLTVIEERLLQEIDNREVAEIRYYQAEPGQPIPRLDSLLALQSTQGIGAGASGVLLIGDGPAPSVNWSAAFSEMRRPIVASPRTELLKTVPDTGTAVRLERKLDPEELKRIEREERQAKIRNIWIVSIALLVTIIGITNSLLMSVTERFKEIGTMKCLGALSSFIRRIFFIESALTGLVGSLIGGVLGFLVAAVIYAFTFGFGLVFASIDYSGALFLYLIAVACGILMSILAAIYPASFASRMVPATALRSNI
ncbi:FtsX-like permease family protein [Puniceicoccus vermicola]|uniref:FtsX-like permease family protein n=1 Tax=Puniceicoccus vermicola TaxID=388746 RepID=A0A7X1E502_9BACT|nr:FtsX-like permease family protein [Puniceicoccus vermicola]MBC2602538.1 FtsX-like permease family protein [Puniceicoccus vermicola]